jgi:hypothetical protein
MITATMPVIKHCPFVEEIDAGELEIIQREDAPELHNLAARVMDLCGEAMTHEDFTRGVLDLLGGEGLVVTRWHTGPWEVVCHEGDLTLLLPVPATPEPAVS